MSLQILSDVIYLYIVMIFLYLVIPLIMYLVSLVQNASLKKNDLYYFFFLSSPPCLEHYTDDNEPMASAMTLSAFHSFTKMCA
jgi:hypothetical protein